MTAKIHAENPADPAACTCGYRYPEYCRGGIPIMLATDREKITSRAAAGMSFRQIAAETGVTLHTVRRIVHG